MEAGVIPLPEGGYGSAHDLARQVVDTEFFDDAARRDLVDTEGVTNVVYAERAQLAISVARAVASVCWEKRAALRHDEQYCAASPDERRELVMPRNEDLDELREGLEPVRHRLIEINNLDAYVTELNTGTTASVLHRRQHAVFDALQEFVNKPGKQEAPGEVSTKAGYIKMPTGTGKTVVGVEIFKAFGKPKTLFLTSRKDIVDQIVGKDGERGFAEFSPDTRVTKYYEGEQDLDGEVVVMTYASFNNLIAEGLLDKRFCGLIVCDEAHRALGPTTSKNLEEYGKGKILIGLTATDEYAENRKVDQLFPEQIYEIGLRDCIDNGWLSSVQAWIYKTDVQIDRDTRRKEFSTAEFRRLAEVEGRNQKAVEFAKAFVEQGLQGLMSCVPGENVRHAEDIAAKLRTMDVVDPETKETRKMRAQELRGEMTQAERRTYYADFEAGRIDVLTFVDVIGEGWDSNAAKFLINLRPTCSPVFGVQRLGRILRRGAHDMPAQVVDFVDESARAQFTALHALGEYRFDVSKIYGQHTNSVPQGFKRMSLPPYLLRHIQQINLRKVAELVVGRPYEAVYSASCNVAELADTIGMSSAAILLIAEEYGMTVESTEGGLGAPTAVISEIDHDKIRDMVRAHRYDWLVGQSDEWVADYVARREERLRNVQANVTAIVVDSAELRAAAAEEKAAEEAAAALVIKQAEAERAQRMERHMKKDLHELLQVLTVGKISPEDMAYVIRTQVAKGEMLPMAVVRIGMSGKQEGPLGIVQKALIEGLMKTPQLATSAINIGIQTKLIDSAIHDTKSKGRRWVSYMTTRVRSSDEPIQTWGRADEAKVAQHVAAVYTLATLAGIDPYSVPNPYAEDKVPQVTPLPEIDLPDIEHPRSDFAAYFARSPGKPQYYSLGSFEDDGEQVAYAELKFKIGKERFQVIGSGVDYRRAQIDATRRALIVHGEALESLRALPQFQIERLYAVSKKKNPTGFLIERSERLKLKAPVYGIDETDEGVCATVTVADNFGRLKTFRGPAIANYHELSQDEQRKAARESRAEGARLAVEAFRPRKPEPPTTS